MFLNGPASAGFFCANDSTVSRLAKLFLEKFPGLKSLFTDEKISLTIQRLAYRVLENHPALANTVFIGLQPRGVYLSNRLVEEIGKIAGVRNIAYGKLDITFYRDDIRKEVHLPNQTQMDFSVEDKHVVLIDDVLYTGRTIRAALDALMDFGRPARVELLVLIDRRYSRQLPIQARYVGHAVDSIGSQKVKVLWKEKDGKDEVLLV